jgi:hypothetical protein
VAILSAESSEPVDAFTAAFQEEGYDETSHAGWLRGLLAKMKEGSLSISRDRFKLQPVRGFSGYLERELATANEPGMSPINALSVALYIEESIIEQRYFEVLAADGSIPRFQARKTSSRFPAYGPTPKTPPMWFRMMGTSGMARASDAIEWKRNWFYQRNFVRDLRRRMQIKARSVFPSA